MDISGHQFEGHLQWLVSLIPQGICLMDSSGHLFEGHFQFSVSRMPQGICLMDISGHLLEGYLQLSVSRIPQGVFSWTSLVICLKDISSFPSQQGYFREVSHGYFWSSV
jgi:hypothetical protein